MKYNNILPAIPGTMVIWYNHCHNTTQSEPILFWGVAKEDGDPIPYVVPFTLCIDGHQATPFELPNRTFEDSDERACNESRIIAFEIPGWGRISAWENSKIWGNFSNQEKGFVIGLSSHPRKTDKTNKTA